MANVMDRYRTVTPYLLVPNVDVELTFLKAAFDSTEVGCQRNQENAARALAAGATSESKPEDKPYGHRNAGVVDQNGVTWWIAAPVE